MRWIHNFQLFLFDFDGLLVNTEKLHHQAYTKMCADRGFDLNWTFPRYCKAAHYSATALEEQIYAQFPQLQADEPSWQVLYEEKKKNYMDLLLSGQVELMPGVEKLLLELDKTSIKRCVVTHSLSDLVSVIRQQNSILNTIPHWITREDYVEPKPASDGYIEAIKRYAAEGDSVVGFEDSPRGMQSLLGTRALPVMVAENREVLKQFEGKQIVYFPSFLDIPDESALDPTSPQHP